MLLHVNVHDFINLMDAHGGDYSAEAAMFIYEHMEEYNESWIFDPTIIRSDFIEADVNDILGYDFIQIDKESFEEKDYDEQLEIIKEELEKNLLVLGETPNGLVHMAV